MSSLKNLFSSLFGSSKKNKIHRKKRTNTRKTRKSKTHKKRVRGG